MFQDTVLLLVRDQHGGNPAFMYNDFIKMFTATVYKNSIFRMQFYEQLLDAQSAHLWLQPGVIIMNFTHWPGE